MIEEKKLKQTVSNKDILKLIETRENTYLNDPLQIVADYNNEDKNITDYVGRQLLEMIQNANDECENTFKEKKILIKLEENTLIIANNGNPFSKGGVESLMYSDLSPKVNEANKVGQKGLGFRSILNWSEEIYISSYDLNIKFSEKESIKFLKNLIEKNPEIRTKLAEKSKEKHPISILRCPVLVTDTSLKKVPEYDTVIELTLKNGVKEGIIKQIEKEIIPEIIVFLHKVKEIEIETEEHHFSIKKITEDDFVVIERENFITNEKEEWTWHILDEEGVLEGEKGVNKNYELKIAYNPDMVPSTQKLYTYFRTKVDFPYPVLAHGTFELNSNRNELSEDEDGFNELLVAKLANLLVECSLKLTESKVSSYDALKLLIPTGYQHSSLYEDPWNFDDLIKGYINETAIFPTITNEYITLEEDFKFYKVAIDHLIPNRYLSDFRTLLKSTSDNEIIDYFSEEHEDIVYPEKQFTEKLNKIINDNGFSIDEKVEWIDILSRNTKNFYHSEKPTLPNLLINAEGEIINTGKEEIILPPKESTYKLPTELELQFIGRDFTEKLKEQIDGDIRNLSTRLRVFQVDEYSMTVVARKVISASHKLLDNANEKSPAIVSGMHTVLFHIYNGLDEEDKRSFFPNLPSPLLYSLNGDLKAANKLYFGKDYDAGYLCKHLLKSIEEDVFIGSLEKNGLSDLIEEHQISKLEKYLKWIGVADMPRRKIIENNSIPNKQEYVNYIFDNLSYPYSLPDDPKTFETREEIGRSYSHDINVLWYDYFEEIIENTAIEFLLAWFIKDREINNSLVIDNDHDKAELWFLFDSVRNHRYLEDNDVRSYLLFILKNTKFIPVDGGKKANPTECVANSGNLSPLVHTPQINYDADVFNYYNIKEDQIELLLNRLGVKESFKELSVQVMYRLLNEHHNHFNKNKSSASVLYNAIIDATMNLPKDFNWDFDERNEYIENGVVLSIVNGKNEYVPISEATYVLNPNHSQDLLAKLKVSKIRQRVGNTRIKELFGVQPMDHIEFKVKKPWLNEKLNDEFQQEFTQLKPLLFVYRQQKNLTETQKKRELSSLKELKIKICFNADVKFDINTITQQLKLKDNEYVYEKETQTYYVQVNQNITSYKGLKQEYRFTETLSDIICGALTVTENRKDFMLIIREDQSIWKEIMTREFPDFSEIEVEVMKNFEGALTSKQLFWRTILKCIKTEFTNADLTDEKEIYKYFNNKIPWDDFFDIYRGLNYYEPSTNANYKFIKRIFNSLNIGNKDFNKYSKNDLNFKDYYLNLFQGIHNSFSKKYKSILYLKGYSDSFVDKIEAFDTYDFEAIEIPNELNLDLNKLYKKELSEYSVLSLFEVKEADVIDVEKVYKSSLKTFKKQLQDENIFDRELLLSLQYDNEFKNNIYFSVYPKLLEIYKVRYLSEDAKRRTVSLSSTGDEIDIEDDESLMAQIISNIEDVDLNIEFHTPERVEVNKNKGKGKNSGQSTNNLPSTGIPNSDIGFIGEKYAFELLKKTYDEVIWKSEYAIRAGFSGGKDGFGYDFECTKDNETRYVEVKATTTSNCMFHISKNEVKVGHANNGTYDVLLISNLLSDNIKAQYLKNIFQYKESDTFFENSSFLVETDGYKIKFK